MAKPKGFYAKKKYALPAVRAHVHDSFKEDPAKTLDDVMLGLEKSTKEYLRRLEQEEADAVDDRDADEIADAIEWWQEFRKHLGAMRREFADPPE